MTSRVLTTLAFSLAMAASPAGADEPLRLHSPAATLGTPRATLGTPIAAKSPAPATIGAPVPVIRGQIPDLKFPDFSDVLDAPKSGPKPKTTDGKSGSASPEPLTAPGTTLPAPKPMGLLPTGPASTITCEPPLFGSQLGACPPPVDCSRWYGSAEYLLWWTRSMSVPVLATTGPVGSGGIPGIPGVAPLFGGDTLDPSLRSGVRFNLGYWFGECRNWGIDAGLFVLGSNGGDFSVGSQSVPVIARPFFAPNRTLVPVPNLAIPGPLSEVVADPLISAGAIHIEHDSTLWGADLNARRRGWSGCSWHLDWLAGYRYLHLDEELQITERFSGLVNPFQPAIADVNGIITDRFHTSNQFHGGQIGAILEGQRGRWSLGLQTKVALGVTSSTADIEGGLRQFGPSFVTPTVPGGLLALNSNIGHYTKNEFAVVPEFNLNLGYDITPRCRLFVGYSFLYWSSVLRPGDQIDTTLDVRRIPIFTDPLLFPATSAVVPFPAPRPAAMLKDTDFWAQGFNFGLRMTW